MAKGKSKELIDYANLLCEEGFGDDFDVFGAGLLTYADLGERAEGLKSLAAKMDESAKRLAAKLTEFAEANPELAFDEGLVEVKSGQFRGVVTLDKDERFIYTRSNTEYERPGGGNLTQDFLKTLPKDWRKETLYLAKSELKGVSDEELGSHELKRAFKRTWRKETKRCPAT